MTVAELLGRISSYELSEWMQYYEIKRKEEEKVAKQSANKKPGRFG